MAQSRTRSVSSTSPRMGSTCCSPRPGSTTVASQRPRQPPGWIRVLDSDLMTRWNQHHDTVGVLPSDLWAHPRFTVLARHDGDDLTGGAILHDAGTVVGLSNTWSSEDVPVDPRELLDLAARPTPVGPSPATPGARTLRPCWTQGSSHWVRTTFGSGSGPRPTPPAVTHEEHR